MFTALVHAGQTAAAVTYLFGGPGGRKGAVLWTAAANEQTRNPCWAPSRMATDACRRATQARERRNPRSKSKLHPSTLLKKKKKKTKKTKKTKKKRKKQQQRRRQRAVEKGGTCCKCSGSGWIMPRALYCTHTVSFIAHHRRPTRTRKRRQYAATRSSQGDCCQPALCAARNPRPRPTS
jgi:hypothetical protein